MRLSEAGSVLSSGWIAAIVSASRVIGGTFRYVGTNTG